MDEDGRIRRGFLQLIQSGAYREIFGFKDDTCGIVECVLKRIYRIRFGRKHVVLDDREEEVVRTQLGKQWKDHRPIALARGRVVIDRKSGEILASPSLGQRMKADVGWARTSGAPKSKDGGNTAQGRGQ